jgi:hypothetical protein
MGGVSLEGALDIFLRFMRVKFGILNWPVHIFDGSVRTFGKYRDCKVIKLTDEILDQVHVNVDGVVRYIKLVGYIYGPIEYYQPDDPGTDTSWPALIVCCDKGDAVLRTFECRSDMRSVLDTLIISNPEKSSPSNPLPSSVTPSSDIPLRMGDVYEIFVEFMRKILKNNSLTFDFDYGYVGARGCRVIKLKKDILSQIRIGRLNDICFIKLCGCEDGANKKPASIVFANSQDAEVWSVDGDRSALLSKLDQLITYEISVSEPSSVEPKPVDPTPEEYTAELEQIIRICKDLIEQGKK